MLISLHLVADNSSYLYLTLMQNFKKLKNHSAKVAKLTELLFHLILGFYKTS